MSDAPSFPDLRKEYGQKSLKREDLAADPIAQFEHWFADASRCPEIAEPNVMSVATADAHGDVSVRILLLKGLGADGFRFFTNFESLKGRQLAENTRAALLFYWPPLERQVKVRGAVERLSEKDSEAYFHSRPRGSQLGAWASAQSEVIPSRDEQEERVVALEKKYEGKTVPLPPFWGGYLLRPDVFEFWQGGKNRLHDSFRYRRDGSVWVIERLAP